MAKIQTVTIIEYAGDDLLGITSYSNDDEGNKEAEAHFSTILKENEVPEEDIDSFTEDGYWEQGDLQIFLTHSE